MLSQLFWFLCAIWLLVEVAGGVVVVDDEVEVDGLSECGG